MKKKIFLALTILAVIFFLGTLWFYTTGFQDGKKDHETLKPDKIATLNKGIQAIV